MTPLESAVLVLVSAGLLGALIGSFLNVVVYRLPRECMSIVRPGSHCPSCSAPIRPWDNVPLLSYLALRGRCRACRAPISARYFLVELAGVSLFLGLANQEIAQPLLLGGEAHWARALALMALLAALLAAALIDRDLYILPDEITLGGLAVVLVVAVAVPQAGPGASVAGLTGPVGSLLWSLLGAVVGAGILSLVGEVGWLLFRKDAMGLGDVKLGALLGAALGWKGAALSVLVAVFAGAVLGIAIIAMRRRAGERSSYIPFGMHLALGALVVVFAEDWVLKAISAYGDWVRGA